MRFCRGGGTLIEAIQSLPTVLFTIELQILNQIQIKSGKSKENQIKAKSITRNPNQKQNKSDITDTPDRRQFQIRTLNKFDVIADASEADDLGPNDSDVAPVTQPENNNNPWFEKFEVKQPPSQVVRRKRGANES